MPPWCFCFLFWSLFLRKWTTKACNNGVARIQWALVIMIQTIFEAYITLHVIINQKNVAVLPRHIILNEALYFACLWFYQLIVQHRPGLSSKSNRIKTNANYQHRLLNPSLNLSKGRLNVKIQNKHTFVKDFLELRDYCGINLRQN